MQGSAEIEARNASLIAIQKIAEQILSKLNADEALTKLLNELKENIGLIEDLKRAPDTETETLTNLAQEGNTIINELEQKIFEKSRNSAALLKESFDKLKSYYLPFLTSNNSLPTPTIKLPAAAIAKNEQLHSDKLPILVSISSNIIRERLHSENQVKVWLKDKISDDLQLGAAISQGDCFYDAVAQGLNQKNGKEEYIIKSLRLLCDEYVKNLKNSWVEAANKRDREDHQSYLVRIQFTAQELLEKETQGLKLGTAVWGRPKIEGRIFCEQFNIKIHVIEIQEDGSIHRYLMDKNGETEDYNPAIDYSDNNILHIVNYRNHYVPLLNKQNVSSQPQKVVTSSQPVSLPLQLTNTNDGEIRNNTIKKQCESISTSSSDRFFPSMTMSHLYVEKGDIYATQTYNVYQPLPLIMHTITGQDINKIKERLEKCYSHQKYQSFARISGEILDMQDCYVNLSIIDHNTQQEKEKKALKELQSNFTRLPTYEKIYDANYQDLIEIKDIFNERPKEELERKRKPQRILVLGRAGIGKTTLCKKIVYEFFEKNNDVSIQQSSSGIWKDKFNWLIWVPFRNLKKYSQRKKPYTLEDMFYQEYFHDKPDGKILAQKLWQIVLEKSGKTLYLLDGWDEVSFVPEKSSIKLLLNELLNKPFIIVTSRPYANYSADTFDLELETIGFSKKNVQQYLDNVLSKEPNTKQEIKEFINHNLIIQGLVNIPIQLDILCYSRDVLKQRLKEKGNQAITMTQLYQAMVEKLWLKYIERPETKQRLEANAKFKEWLSAPKELISEQIEEMIRLEKEYLETLAFEGLKENKIIFDSNFLKEIVKSYEKSHTLEINVLKEAKETGFVTTTDSYESNDRNEYNFIHLTFQEYLAAHYIAKHISCQNIQNFILQYKYNTHYNLVWPFAAGLLRNHKENLILFWKLILDASSQDILGFAGIELVINCLAECGNDLDSSLKKSLLSQVKPWLMLLLNCSKKQYLPMFQHLMQVFIQRPTIVRQTLPWGEINFVNIKEFSYKAICTVYLQSWANSPEIINDFLPFCFKILSLENDKFFYFKNYFSVENAIVLYTKNHPDISVYKQLIEILRNKTLSINIRDIAFEALANIPNPSKEIIEILFNVLEEFSILGDQKVDYGDFETDVRPCDYFKGIKALCNIINPSADILQALFATLKSEINGVCESALEILSHFSNSSPEWVPALLAVRKKEYSKPCYDDEGYENGQYNYPSVNEHVIKVLIKISSTSNAIVRALIQELNNKDNDVREAIIKVLGAIPEPSTDVIKALLGAAKDSNSNIRDTSIKILSSLPTPPPELILVLIAVPKDKKIEYDPDDGEYEYFSVNENVIQAFGRISNPSTEMVQALILAVKDKNKDNRICEAIIKILANISNPSTEVIKILIDYSNDRNIKNLIRKCLLKIPNPSAEVLYALLLVSLEEHKQQFPYHADIYDSSYVSCYYFNVSQDAIEALTKNLYNNSNKIISFILNALNRNENDNLRLAAVETLGNVPNPSDDIIAALRTCLKDKNYNIRHKAAYALINNIDFSREVIKTLIVDIELKEKYRDWSRAVQAIKIFGNLSQPTQEIISVLLKALKDNYKPVRDTAVTVLGKFQNYSSEITEALICLYNEANKESNVRSLIIKALGNISKPSEVVKQIFRDASGDKNLRKSVIEIIGNNYLLLNEFLQFFIETLGDRNNDICEMAITALKRLPHPNITLLQTIYRNEYASKCLNNKIKAVFVELYGVSNPSVELVSFLISKVQKAASGETDNTVNNSIAYAILVNMSCPSVEVTKLLIVAAKDDNRYVRYASVKMLTTLPSFPLEIQELFLSALNDKDFQVGQIAFEAFTKISDPSNKVVSAILAVLKTKNYLICERLISELSKSTNITVLILHIFFKGLKCDKYTRRAASAVIDRLNPLPITVIPGLLDAMHDENQEVRFYAIKCLKNISYKSDEIIQATLDALRLEADNITEIISLNSLSKDSVENYRIDQIVKNTINSFTYFSKIIGNIDIIFQSPYLEIFLYIITQCLIQDKNSHKFIFTLLDITVDISYKQDEHQKILAVNNKIRNIFKLPPCIRFPEHHVEWLQSKSLNSYLQTRLNSITIFPIDNSNSISLQKTKDVTISKAEKELVGISKDESQENSENDNDNVSSPEEEDKNLYIPSSPSLRKSGK